MAPRAAVLVVGQRINESVCNKEITKKKKWEQSKIDSSMKQTPSLRS